MNRIKELRKKNNITVKELAKELEISQSMLTNYENGNATPRDNTIWEKLADMFGVSESHIMGLTMDIDQVNNNSSVKLRVDKSKPLSVQINTQSDIDILLKLDILDDEDTKKVLEYMNELLADDKYNGYDENRNRIFDKPIQFVVD